VPFLAALAIVVVGRAAGLSGVAPPGPVGPGAVPIHTGGVVLLAALAAVIGVSFALLLARGGMRALAGRVKGATASENGNAAGDVPNGRHSRPRAKLGRAGAAEMVGDPGAAAAILISSCALALVVWGANPFAALLLVPALHLWMVALAPEPAIRPVVRIVLLALGLAPPALLVAYYAISLGFGPIGLAWTGVLMVVGGQIGIPTAILLCLLMGCAVSAVVNALATARAQVRVPPTSAPITVRGPVTYAGPGSLGGTASALSRAGSSLRR
jgi:hypothetical protein